MYWGHRLPASQEFAAPKQGKEVASFDGPVTVTPHEYIGWGGVLYVEPDLKVTFPDGNRDLVLQYVSSEAKANEISVRMKDIERAVFVTLVYRMDAATGVLAREAVVENETKGPIRLEQVQAATWNLPRGDHYRLHYVTGRWAGEDSLKVQPVQGGKTVLESRRGTTGAQNNPWFMIDDGTSEDQDAGEVWFGALGWSGSWQIAIEQNVVKDVRVTGGSNAFDFGYQLKAGETFETPWFYGGYSHAGVGGASRLLHRFEVDNILPNHPHEKIRPVLYNSWEATTFAVTAEGQMALAEKAAKMGVERFVIDDGWFGQRKDDHAGLGDWYVNKEKFPQGLKPLIDKVHGLGMDFGIWVEPEMVNPDSDLYRKHPDWVLNFTGRPRTEGRNQLVLNLARKDVHDYTLEWLDKLLTENRIAFLKWDYNRNWAEPGWPAVSPEEQKNVYVDFIRNYYDILEQLRKRHPGVEIESCSGGGGRVDLGVMKLTDEVWTSDNTDAYDRLTIQNGFTYAYTPAAMMAWVTDSPTWVNNRTLSLEYRFLSSMQGSLGVGANLNHWKDEDFATASKMIAAYKEIRETVQRGELYRLMEPETGEQSVTESVARDGKQAVLFAFLHSSTKNYPFPRVKLRGLEEDAVYSLKPIAGKASEETPVKATGGYWMHHGVDVMLKGDFQAAAFVLTRE
ncbi:MAG: alpha-galactosidase [Edaphobacter sp.]|uniref:alpha-galactosidase n=1 Tax=Edaphobacter sp. TaxID=1934404 RepID=UPI0023960D52|nr:alpha-galactosidase [Edaphobacter sp.]MDE1175848.1 alpha-galactosidase [Edaphobacter sp.]